MEITKREAYDQLLEIMSEDEDDLLGAHFQIERALDKCGGMITTHSEQTLIRLAHELNDACEYWRNAANS